MFVVTYITIRKHERYVSSWVKNKAGSRVSAGSMNTGCLQGAGDRSWDRVFTLSCQCLCLRAAVAVVVVAYFDDIIAVLCGHRWITTVTSALWEHCTRALG